MDRNRRERLTHEGVAPSASGVRDRPRINQALPVLPTDAVVANQADAVLRILDGEPSVGKMVQIASNAAQEQRKSTEAGKHECPETACAKQCFYCCHLTTIAVAIPEVLAVAEHVKRTTTPDELDALRRRIDTHIVETNRFSGEERERFRYPCPLLAEGDCSVYEVRPLACQGWNSLDVSKCREDFLNPERDVVAPVSRPQVENSWKLRAGMYLGLRRAGLKGERVDFIPALKIAMDRPDVLRRWLGGESLTDPESDALNVDPAPSDHPTPDPL